jgi:hypothetical protein
MPSFRGNCDIGSMRPPDSMLASFSYTNSYDYFTAASAPTTDRAPQILFPWRLD